MSEKWKVKKSAAWYYIEDDEGHIVHFSESGSKGANLIAAHTGCTCAQIADACRISSRLMATKLRTLSKAGTIQSVKIRDGKNLSGYCLPRERREYAERGPYVPPPGPFDTSLGMLGQ